MIRVTTTVYSISAVIRVFRDKQHHVIDVACPHHDRIGPAREKAVAALAVGGGGRLWTPLRSIIHSMQTVQIVLDEALLAAADEAARREKLNRSALVREALRHYLKRRRIEELEQRDRQGFERLPDESGDAGFWEQAAAWPDD